MALVVVPFQFKGACAGCGRQQSGKGAAVAVGVGDVIDDEGDEHLAEWLCGRCARRLAKKILVALARAKTNVALGLIYRNESWVRGKR